MVVKVLVANPNDLKVKDLLISRVKELDFVLSTRELDLDTQLLLMDIIEDYEEDICRLKAKCKTFDMEVKHYG